jgi:hypothetical protein
MDIRLLIVFACALAFLGITIAVLRRFFGTELQGFRARAAAAFHGSSTIFVARLTALGAASLEIASNGADILGAPGIRDAVQGIIPPSYWPMALLVFALVTELARRRSLLAGDQK